MITAVLAFIPGRVGILGISLCLLLLFAFTATVIPADVSEGCGCWTGAQHSKGAILTSNATLVLVALVSMTGSTSTVGSSILFGLGAGSLSGLIIMEVPNIRQYFIDAAGVAP